MARPEIAALDRALAQDGETVLLRRRVGTSAVFVEITLKARLDGYRAETLIGDIKQTFSGFVFSPTAINAAVAAGTWPGAAAGGTLPKVGDFLRSVGGVDRKIEAVQPVRVGDVIVRFNGQVLG
jgi:hypothetical protein